MWCQQTVSNPWQMLLPRHGSVAPLKAKEHGGGRFGAPGGPDSLPQGLPLVVLQWECGSRAKAVEEAGYRVGAGWVLYQKCLASQFATSAEAAELPCGALTRSWAGEEQCQMVVSDAVRNPPISRATSAPPRLSSSEDREVGSCPNPKAARHGTCSFPNSPFQVELP